MGILIPFRKPEPFRLMVWMRECFKCHRLLRKVQPDEPWVCGGVDGCGWKE